MLDYLPLLANGRARLVIDYHAVTPPAFTQGAARQILQDGYRQRGLAWCSDWVLAHSQFAADELVRATSFPGERVACLDLPIEEGFHPGPVRGALKQKLGIGEGRILLFVGRIAANKRPSVLVEALSRLKEARPGFHAVFVGDTSDVYAAPVRECVELARKLGVEERVHFPGQLSLDDLADAYRSADLFVMPSLHEGFCLPVREAMACGLPVLAARSAALPETVGDAGLTFTPDDPEDLARQVRRIFQKDFPAGSKSDGSVRPSPDLRARPRRIALVCFRFGQSIVGGAERSIQTIGEALSNQGFGVEVFTTCNLSESDWKNEAKAGSMKEGGLLINRFPMDPHDRERHLQTLTRLHSSACSPELAEEYLRHSIHSSALLCALDERMEEFDALIVGPYLFGLSCDVARRFPEKSLLLPCFHDEPLAWLPTWPSVYSQVGGILYHTPEEQEFAQARLGITHPNSGVVGTFLAKDAQDRPSRQTGMSAPRLETTSKPGKGRQECLPYLVYCGRYSVEKNLPRVLEFAERYQRLRPGRVDFVFMGRGEVQLPKRDWLVDLGRVDEERKAQVLRDAVSLVQLSDRESLSLVVLEAWREGTPVLVSKGSPVLCGQVERSGGGVAIETFDEFARALDQFLEQPGVARAKGDSGQAHVRARYLDEEAFAGRVRRHIENLARPLIDLMKEKGLERARRSSRAGWREGFGQWLEKVLDAPERERRLEIKVAAPTSERRGLSSPCDAASPLKVALGRRVLVPLVLSNEGTLPAADRGPGRVLILGEIESEDGVVNGGVVRTELPRLLVPGESVPAALTFPCPPKVGRYRIQVWTANAEGSRGTMGRKEVIQLLVHENVADASDVSMDDLFTPDSPSLARRAPGSNGLPYLDVAREALAEAHSQRRLPDDYVDVTQGRFAKIKRWIKQKFLGNFRRAYVDVLSRQQSEVNEQLIVAIGQLASHCGTLEHALAAMQERLDQLEKLQAAPPRHDGEGDGSKASSQEYDQLTGLPSA